MKPLIISEIGLKGNERVLIQTVLDLAAGMEVGNWQFSDDPVSASLLFVNMDSLIEWEDEASAGGEDLLIVACSDQPLEREGLLLHRPLSYRGLVNILRQAESSLRDGRLICPAPRQDALGKLQVMPADDKGSDVFSTALNEGGDSTSTPPVNAALLEAPEAESFGEAGKYVYLPQKREVVKSRTRIKSSAEQIQLKNRPAMRFFRYTRILGLLQSIVDREKSVYLSHPELPPLVICPKQELFGSVVPLDSRPELFRTPAYKFHVHEIPPPGLEEVFDDLLVQPLWALFYSAALYGAEGRLLEYCGADDLLQLERSPNFREVPHTRDHIVLANYLLKNRVDLLTLAESTGVDLGVLIDFCNGCEEANLIKREPVLQESSVPADELGEQAETSNIYKHPFPKNERKTKFRHVVSAGFKLEKDSR